jgi:hypothetical protein
MTPRFTMAVVRDLSVRFPGFHLGMLAEELSPMLKNRLAMELQTADPMRLMEIVREGLYMETDAGDAEEVDVVLAQLQQKTPGQKMTWRFLVHMGLSAGLALPDMDSLTPGEIADLYILRRRYDDQQHGIHRAKPAIYD